MLQSFCQSPDWLYSEPLLFDDDFCQSLMKDLQSLPTPPQSPPTKAAPGGGKPLSKEDQLSYVSDVLLEDHDMQHLAWTCDFFGAEAADKESCRPGAPLDEGGEDLLWRCLAGDRTPEDKPTLGSSPPLADIDASIFEEIAGSALDFQGLGGSRDSSESTSDYGSTGGDMSACSSSDSEEEIDVVTVVQRTAVEEQRALQQLHIEIQLQHNYAAPYPASPPAKLPASNKRSHLAARGAASSSSRFVCASRSSTETEDEEERRRTHNVMERQRRNELKNCFLRLRDNVPELSRNDKASKVVILKKARDCVHGLEDESRRLHARRDRLRARQEALKGRLQQLRS